eukprot:366257-Chlamydomonas_euryale.AAC.2
MSRMATEFRAQVYIDVHMNMYKHACRPASRQAGGHPGRQARRRGGRQPCRRAGMQAHTHACSKAGILVCRHAGRQAGMIAAPYNWERHRRRACQPGHYPALMRALADMHACI